MIQKYLNILLIALLSINTTVSLPKEDNTPLFPKPILAQNLQPTNKVQLTNVNKIDTIKIGSNDIIHHVVSLSEYSILSQKLFLLQNQLRKNPAKYYQNLLKEGNNETAKMLSNNLTPVQLQHDQLGVESLKYSLGLQLSAQDLIVEQSHSGEIGHIGSTTPYDRIHRYGDLSKGKYGAGEIIVYGLTDANEIINSIINDKLMFENLRRENFKSGAISCGYHNSSFQTSCVFVYADNFINKLKTEHKFYNNVLRALGLYLLLVLFALPTTNLTRRSEIHLPGSLFLGSPNNETGIIKNKSMTKKEYETLEQVLFNNQNGIKKAGNLLVANQGSTGVVGHYTSDRTSPTDRMNKYGKWNKFAAENISYGTYKDSFNILAGLINSPGHFKNMFSENYLIGSVSCGPHPIWVNMCAFEFAYAFESF
ncbi:hypothetical protein HK099_005120 [Clydaea vesicula]|uniref:SCP domain-containing protein n=1 Tax=Clydaea vesicula TaxID=447962 RepID=A0AAD5TZ68_9FUNG|nr:hypothetical protein HK099_005120 [Clydaea vesicula]